MKMLILMCLIALVPFGLWAQSFDLCDAFFRTNKSACTGAANALGGSYSSISDAVGVNPASIPIYDTPLGIEYVNSEGKNAVGLIKGQDGWGAGFSATDRSRAFFSASENYQRSFSEVTGTNSFKLQKTNLDANLLSAIDLLKLKPVALPLGLGYKFNSESKAWSPTLGFGIKTQYFNLGVSGYQDPEVTHSDPVVAYRVKSQVLSGNLGLHFGSFLLDYTQFMQKSEGEFDWQDPNHGNDQPHQLNYQIITQVISLAYVSQYFNLTYAYRFQRDSREKDHPEMFTHLGASYAQNHQLYGLTLRLSRYLNIGYFYNQQLQNDSSLLAQLFLPLGF